MYYVNFNRIPQQGRSLCSSFVLSFSLIIPTKFYTQAKLRFANNCENTTKKQLCQVQKGSAETRISKNLRPSKFEPHAHNIQPRMLKTPKN